MQMHRVHVATGLAHCPSIKSTPGVVPNIIGNENNQTQLVHQQAWVRTRKANVHRMKSHLEGAFEVVSNREKKVTKNRPSQRHRHQDKSMRDCRGHSDS